MNEKQVNDTQANEKQAIDWATYHRVLALLDGWQSFHAGVADEEDAATELEALVTELLAFGEDGEDRSNAQAVWRYAKKFGDLSLKQQKKLAICLAKLAAKREQED
jgi:hypothetical protein